MTTAERRIEAERLASKGCADEHIAAVTGLTLLEILYVRASRASCAASAAAEDASPAGAPAVAG